jgi:predicted nucleic acid-binding protein
VIYLDSSAVVKLARREEHSETLIAWLSDRADPTMASSVVVEIEVIRALRRYDPAAIPVVAHVLSRLYRVDLNPTIRTMAGDYSDGSLRSLDAIHLATAHFLAISTGAWPTVVAYDSGLLAAARGESFIVAAPGLGA